MTEAASVALSVAKTLLGEELQDLTQRYNKLLEDKKEMIEEIGNIDLDSETANFFMQRLTKVTQGNIDKFFEDFECPF